LVAVLGVVVGLVSVLFLQDYLVGRLDRQLSLALSIGVEEVQRSGNLNASVAVGQIGQARGTFAAIVENGQVLNGSVLGPSGVDAVTGTLPSQLASLPTDGTPETFDFQLGEIGEYRLAAAQIGGDIDLVVGLPLTEVQATASQLVFVILVVTVIASAIAAGLGLLIVRLALRPLDRVVMTATQVSELPLDRGEVALAVRVPEEDTDPRTEVGRVGAALNNMLVHVSSALVARQASENKVRQFVADASHELRTPLASIRGYAELTRRGPEGLPPDAVRSVGRIESEAERMTVLVEDLLLLARLDEGRALESEPVDLSRLLIDATSDAHAAGPDHRWALDLPEEPVIVTGDEQRLHQVIVNLLANARVHTPAGTLVTVALAVKDAPRPTAPRPVGAHPVAPRTAVITVTDDGPGIPPELVPKLFERFARGDSSRSRETGSTGLGLAIVYAVVEAAAGEVTVESEPGRTVFSIALPTDSAPPTPRP
jgi:two-component system OmpR family sensor kinase